MTRGWIVLVAALTIVAGCAGPPTPRACPLPGPVTVQPPFLWEVRGPSGSVVLFGTHQAAAAADIPAAAWEMLDGAELFVSEVDEIDPTDPREAELWRESLSLPRGQSLMKMLSNAEYGDLEERLHMNGPGLNKSKPWVVLAGLVKTAFVFPDPNMATAFVDHVRGRKQASEFLDTRMQQVEFLDATVPIDGLRDALRGYANLGCSLTSEQAAYRAGLETSFDAEPSPTRGPALTAITARAARWTKQIEAYVGSGRRIFIAVGVANILGSHGIAARLTAAGFNIRRMAARVP